MQDGLQEGIQIGVEHKFGAEGSWLIPEIREIQDVAQLELILRAVWTAGSPEELRRIWAK